MRWSPAVAGLFLLDWVHRRAVLDMDDARCCPGCCAPGPRTPPASAGCPRRRRRATDQAVEEMVPEFARLYSTGERRSPATAAVAQLIAEGVDPDDPAALDAWIGPKPAPPRRLTFG